MSDILEKLITVKVLTNRKSGLLLAVSDELRGLYVHARSDEELNARLPEAIRLLLEAEGHIVYGVTQSDSGYPETGFDPHFFKYDARIAA